MKTNFVTLRLILLAVGTAAVFHAYEALPGPTELLYGDKPKAVLLGIAPLRSRYAWT